MTRALVAAAVLTVLAAPFEVRGAPAPHADASHPDMVLVAAGPFMMGSTQAEIDAARRDYGGSPDLYQPEFPQRRLELPAFWIDRTEVTNAMYRAFVAATGHAVPSEDAVWAAPYAWRAGRPPAGLAEHPVTLVTFDDAKAYCAWRGLTVPTVQAVAAYSLRR